MGWVVVCVKNRAAAGVSDHLKPKFVLRAWQWCEVESYKKRLSPMIGGSAGLGAARRSWWLDMATGMDWGWGGGQMGEILPEWNKDYFCFI